MAASHLNMF
jgi:hypothetical protein